MSELEQLSKAPLFYVLASLRFQPWMSMSERIAAIQDELRDRFPLTNQLTFTPVSNLPEGGGSALDAAGLRFHAWSFMTADRSLGCQISVDQIVVHTTKYTKYADFSKAIKFVFDVVEKHARHFDVNAVGIRYLDKIAPESDETLDQYLAPGFLPQPLHNAEVKTLGGLSQTVYETKTGVLQARFWTGNAYIPIPDDLMPLYVLTQDLSAGPPQIKQLEAGHGTLDSDSIWATNSPVRMSGADVLIKLSDLHEHAGAFFKAACSEHAFKAWGKK